MGNYNKAKGRNKGQKHIQLWNSMQDSEAWLSLSLYARCTWLEIMRRYNGSNNGEIPLGCREVATLCNMSKGKAKDAFDELIEKGFIKIGWHSSFDYKQKKSRRWVLTHHVYDGKAPTNEWRHWQAPENLEHGSSGEPHGSCGERNRPLWE